MEFLKQHVEALIFASPQPVAVNDLKTVMEEAFQAEIKEADILKAIAEIKAQFQQQHYAFELIEIAGGWQFLTKGAYHSTVAIHLRQATKKRLSQAALETLALIAAPETFRKRTCFHHGSQRRARSPPALWHYR